MKDDGSVTSGSGNIFADLGLPDPESELLKARLAAAIRDLIAEANLSQTEAAERMRITQPDVSKLVHGRVAGFSLERLLGFVQALGSDVEIKIRHHGSGQMRLLLA